MQDKILFSRCEKGNCGTVLQQHQSTLILKLDFYGGLRDNINLVRPLTASECKKWANTYHTGPWVRHPALVHPPLVIGTFSVGEWSIKSFPDIGHAVNAHSKTLEDIAVEPRGHVSDEVKVS